MRRCIGCGRTDHLELVVVHGRDDTDIVPVCPYCKADVHRHHLNLTQYQKRKAMR